MIFGRPSSIIKAHVGAGLRPNERIAHVPVAQLDRAPLSYSGKVQVRVLSGILAVLKTRVVNIREERWDVYIGRPGPFGNPFVITAKTTREEVLRKFEIWFRGKLAQDPEWKAKVHQLKGKVLGCFCAPLRCHGHIIAEYLETVPDPVPAAP